MIKHQLRQILIAFDQWLATLVGLVALVFGSTELYYADETLSARSWRLGKNNKNWDYVRRVIDKIFFFDSQHCFSSYLSEFERRHQPIEYKGINNG